MDRSDTTTTAHSAEDLERGRSKDIDTYAATPATHHVTAQNTVPGPPAKKGLYKYLLLGVFCLGVFIDGEYRPLPTYLRLSAN